MAWLVKAVDMTARARMPGTRKSTRVPLIRCSRLRSEPLEHAVAPFEASRDGLAGEGGGHDRQGQDARYQEVDAGPLDQVFQAEIGAAGARRSAVRSQSRWPGW